jgi:hypothetical protein
LQVSYVCIYFWQRVKVYYEGFSSDMLLISSFTNIGQLVFVRSMSEDGHKQLAQGSGGWVATNLSPLIASCMNSGLVGGNINKEINPDINTKTDMRNRSI